LKKRLKGTWRAFVILFIVGTLLIQSGCGFKDIDKRIFVLSIGVDHTDNKEKPYRVILKLSVPSGSLKESGAEYTYLIKESESISTAIRLLKTETDKELDFGHAKVILFGEEILHHDYREIMDFFLRRRDIQTVSWVGVGKPSAEEVLTAEPNSEMAGAHALFNYFDQNGVESQLIVTTYLFDFRRRVLEKGIDPILPILMAKENNKRIDLNKSIVVNDKNEVFTLNEKQTAIYNLLTNNIERLDIRVHNEDVNFTVAIDTANVGYQLITEQKKKPIIEMDVEMIGIIQEADMITNPEKLRAYSNATSKTVKKDVLETLTQFQKNGMDPIGFGVRYKATRLPNNKRNQEWQSLYPEVEFKINVNATLKSTGVIE